MQASWKSIARHDTEPLLLKTASEFLTKLELRDVTLVGESIGGVGKAVIKNDGAYC